MILDLNKVPESKIKELVKRRKIHGYVECSAMTDPESVKKVFEKACKLGLSQIEGINIEDDPVEDVKKCEVKNPCCFL